MRWLVCASFSLLVTVWQLQPWSLERDGTVVYCSTCACNSAATTCIWNQKSSEEISRCTPTRVALKSAHKSPFAVTALKSKSSRKPMWAQGKLNFLASVEYYVIKNWLTRLPHSFAIWVVTALCCHRPLSSSRFFFSPSCSMSENVKSERLQAWEVSNNHKWMTPFAC